MNFGKLLKLKMIKNKRNGQVNIAIPRRQLDCSVKEEMKKYKSAIIRIEGFED